VPLHLVAPQRPESLELGPTLHAFGDDIQVELVRQPDDRADDRALSLVDLHDTLTATHPEEGVRIAKLERPDLVLIEATARSSDPLAACRALRAAPATRAIPIILVMTTRLLGRTPANLHEVCDEQIAKPFDGVEYLMKIRRCLEGRIRS
jgi:PleD family two-component response regulator